MLDVYWKSLLTATYDMLCYTVLRHTRSPIFTLFLVVLVSHFYRLNHCHCIAGNRTTASKIFTTRRTVLLVTRVWLWASGVTLIFGQTCCGKTAKAQASFANSGRKILSFPIAEVIADVVVVLGMIPFLLRRSIQLEAAFVEQECSPVFREVIVRYMI